MLLFKIFRRLIPSFKQHRGFINYNYIMQNRQITVSVIRRKRRQGSALSIADKIAKSDPEYKKKHLAPVVPIWKNITVRELAANIGKSVDHVFEVMIYIPNTNDYDHPSSQIDDLNIIREIVKKSGLRSIVTAPTTGKPGTPAPSTMGQTNAEQYELKPRPIIEKDLLRRDPVVTIMGHVDHGKTTLLDSLRNSNINIVDGEAGGITQHIGAFRVRVGQSQNFVTFLDTPGHAAFSVLRNRGAQATDMVILVVAADDGVMNQTKESIAMAKEANAPIIVAVNKIDKSNADVPNAKSMLLQEGIQLEEFGGDVQCVCISALKGTHLNELIDVILLQAEMMNLRSERKGPVEGYVLESRIDAGRGKLCSGLIQRGTLKKSSFLVAGSAWAKVRALFDENGKIVQEAGPSEPVEIIGWKNELPAPGEKIYEVESEKLAKEIVEFRNQLKVEEKQETDLVAIQSKTQEHLIEYKKQLEKKRLLKRRKLRPEGPRKKEIIEDTDPTPKINLIIKADVEGSLESFMNILDEYDNERQCRLNIIHYGVGDVTENDVVLAESFAAKLYCYNVKIPLKLNDQIKKLSIPIRDSRIIYKLVDFLKSDIESILPMVDKEEVIGTANVQMMFTVTEGKKKIFICGSRCTKGSLLKGMNFRVERGNVDERQIVFDGKVTSMKHLKDEVDTIKLGVECGIALSDTDVECQVGDTIVCYKTTQVYQKCEWDPGF